MGRDRRLHLVRRHGGTPGEGQQDEERREPFMQVHCTKTVSIRLGSLFLTLPTRGLTGEQVISSAARIVAGFAPDLRNGKCEEIEGAPQNRISDCGGMCLPRFCRLGYLWPLTSSTLCCKTFPPCC